MGERAGTLVNTQVIAVEVCDNPSCEGCDSPSDGCKKVFAVAAPVGASPGINPEVIFSSDGFATSDNTDISTMGATDAPSDAACVSPYLVVVVSDTNSLHYANSDNILNGAETWTQVLTGFVVAGSPNAITSTSPRHTWIAGDAGYIYFTDDPTSLVTVQDAGVATVQNLLDIEAFDSELVVAVGASNAVIFSTNGGDTWSSLTGPSAGVQLNTIAIRTETEWWIGTEDGRIYYTLDQGQNWIEKGFTGSGTGSVEKIIWATESVGWMSHTTATPAGRIFRTISGGHTWYIAPEGSGVIPANDEITAMAVCENNPNIVFGGGLADDGSDGVLIKVEPAVID